MISPSPTPRRIKTPTWLDMRLAIGVALVLVSVVCGGVIVSRAHATRPVIVARRDLASGSVLTLSDVIDRPAQLSDAIASRYAATIADVLGRRLEISLSRDELIPLAATSHPPAYTTVTIPLAEDAAPALRPGQRIEVWISSPACASVVLLPDVTVQDVDEHASGFGATGGQSAIVDVPPAWASRVIAALDIADAHIRAGVLAGTHIAADPMPDIRSCEPAGR